jgi:hypothetical protein
MQMNLYSLTKKAQVLIVEQVEKVQKLVLRILKVQLVRLMVKKVNLVKKVTKVILDRKVLLVKEQIRIGAQEVLLIQSGIQEKLVLERLIQVLNLM